MLPNCSQAMLAVLLIIFSILQILQIRKINRQAVRIFVAISKVVSKSSFFRFMPALKFCVNATD